MAGFPKVFTISFDIPLYYYDLRAECSNRRFKQIFRAPREGFMKTPLNTKKIMFILVNGHADFSFAGCTGTGWNQHCKTTTLRACLSDVHLILFNDPKLFPALVAADADQWAGIFQTSK